ncbi:hypothetical protein K438DRAFT_1941251 [Mycena galopus ATCC 62051]|nr:hypothetical protein K438DRAFT_1941251 [Mycena galopus ATCC 62051]
MTFDNHYPSFIGNDRSQAGTLALPHTLVPWHNPALCRVHDPSPNLVLHRTQDLSSRAQSRQAHSGTSSPVSSRATSRSREDSPVQSTSGAPKRSHKRLKGKGKARETDADSDGEDGKVKITLLQDNTTYFLDLSECPEVLDEPGKPGIPRRIDAYIRDEDQDAWGGSTGSKNGDVWVYALGRDRVRARRAHLRQGVCTSMRDLWNHELDANEHEAASVGSILSHIPPNVDEDTFKYVLEHSGQLPGDTPDINVMCALTLHPRIKLKACSYSHVIDNVIHPAKIIRRSCPTELIIFIPVQPHAGAMYVWRPELAFQAIVFLQTAHNHPAHPQAKPSTKDDRLLDAAVTVYVDAVRWEAGGRSQSGVHQHAQNSPTHCCLPEDRVSAWKRFPSVLHHVETHKKPLPIKERYIHAAMTKGDFTLVVILNPQLVYLIHSVLSVVIDYTFKRVEGDMDEWVVSGFSDRFKCQITFARLYCNKKSAATFHQLFYELFDSIHCCLSAPPAHPQAHQMHENLLFAPHKSAANCLEMGTKCKHRKGSLAFCGAARTERLNRAFKRNKIASMFLLPTRAPSCVEKAKSHSAPASRFALCCTLAAVAVWQGGSDNMFIIDLSRIICATGAACGARCRRHSPAPNAYVSACESDDERRVLSLTQCASAV